VISLRKVYEKFGDPRTLNRNAAKMSTAIAEANIVRTMSIQPCKILVGARRIHHQQKFGVADRYSVREGSAFETDMGSGYDYVLLTNIFHHFDMPTCEKLMRRVHAALKPSGKAITLEFVPNEDRVTPPMAAAFSLIMLAGTDAGDAYTFSQYEKMFQNAGFRKTTLHPVPDMPQQVLLSEK